MAMTDAAKEVLYFRNIFAELAEHAKLSFPITLHVDNSAALALAITLVTNQNVGAINSNGPD